VVPGNRLQKAPTGLDWTLSLDYYYWSYLNTAEITEGSYTLGIRPENVTIDLDPSDTVVASTVQVVEPVGSDNYIHIDIGEDFIARVSSRIEPEVGDRVGVEFDEEDIHLFDSETGRDVFLSGTEPAAPKP